MTHRYGSSYAVPVMNIYSGPKVTSHNGITEITMVDPPLKWTGRVTEVAVSQNSQDPSFPHKTVHSLHINTDLVFPIKDQVEAEAAYRAIAKGIL